MTANGNRFGSLAAKRADHYRQTADEGCQRVDRFCCLPQERSKVADLILRVDALALNPEPLQSWEDGRSDAASGVAYATATVVLAATLSLQAFNVARKPRLPEHEPQDNFLDPTEQVRHSV